MKVKDIPILEKKILDMIPITQAEVWKALGINSRDSSHIITGMVDKGIIKRTKADRTFLLETLNGNNDGEKEDVSTVEKTKVESIPTPATVSGDSHNKNVKMTNTKQKILDMLPITQPDMWKKLGINRRSGSRLVNAMLEEGLIKRTKVDNIFLLEKAGEVSHKKEKDFSALLSNNRFSPCCGCMIECDPRTCNMLTEWLI